MRFVLKILKEPLLALNFLKFFKCEKPYFPISGYGEQGLLSTDQLNGSQCG